MPTGDDLTTIELLILYEAGGDNTLGKAYGAVQLYAVFEREQELNDATESALLRLFDLGLVRFVETSRDIGYTAKRHERPAMPRDQLVASFEAGEWGSGDWVRGVDIWFDPTAEGEAVLEAVPQDRIPRVSGRVQRPWLE
jgi:hypothetical protein